MEFGYFTLSDNHYENNPRTPNQFVQDICSEAIYADQLGMHSAWVGEHHFDALGVNSRPDLLLASPAVFAQVWLFIAPGLYAHEKKMALPFILMSSGFFIAGAAFSHYVVFPLTWKFFVSFTSDYLTFMPRIEPAFSLYIKMLLAFGLVFQMPTIVLFLARMGVVHMPFQIADLLVEFVVLVKQVPEMQIGGLELGDQVAVFGKHVQSSCAQC